MKCLKKQIFIIFKHVFQREYVCFYVQINTRSYFADIDNDNSDKIWFLLTVFLDYPGPCPLPVITDYRHSTVITKLIH